LPEPSGLAKYSAVPADTITSPELESVRLATNDATTQTFITKYRPFGASYAISGAELFTFTGK
jgi:hypothetical protein